MYSRHGINGLNHLKIQVWLTFAIAVFLASTCVAQKTLNFDTLQITLEVQKKIIYPNDEIKALLKIKNLENKKKDFFIRSELYSPKGIYIPSPPIEDLLSVDGNSEKSYEMKWYPELSETNETYFVLVKIFEFGKESAININDSFFLTESEVRLISCLDENCNKQTVIFYEGEKVCLKYEERTKVKEINFEIVYPNGEKKIIHLPTCLKDLKVGNYQLVANANVGMEQKIYYLNFSISMKTLAKSPKGTLDFKLFIPVAVVVALVTILLYNIKFKKGQSVFFIKVIFVVISAVLLVLIFSYFSKYPYEIEKEKRLSEFKTEVTNLAQKLLSNPNCLSTSEKSTIDKNKLDSFQQNYAEVEPECAKEINFDYSVRIIQYPKKVAFLPEIKKEVEGTLAWVPNSNDNSISLVSSKGYEIRRHWTVPKGVTGNPSRTAVDSKGNAWVGNRGNNTLVKIAFSEEECIDKNNNGVIETSDDKTIRDFYDDECIVKEIRLGNAFNNPNNIRAVCIYKGDKGDIVYAGHYEEKKLFVISSDGTVKKECRIDGRPYGCVVDKEGYVWISAIEDMRIIKLNPESCSESVFNVGKPTYGIWRGKDYIVFTTWTYNSTVKMSKDGKILWEYTDKNNLYQARGVFVDEEDNVYAVGSGSSKIVKLDKNGKLIKVGNTCKTPTGVSMDSEGNLWVLCRGAGHQGGNGEIAILDNESLSGDTFQIGGDHYAYSDFTGHLTGAKLVKQKIKPIKEVEIEEKEWSFGVKSFSPEKAKEFEVTVSVPISIRYNETFAIEGIAYIYAVKGELESLYGILDSLCERAKEKPNVDVKFSKELHFSYPVKLTKDELCMLDRCKKIVCSVDVNMKDFGEGKYIVNFAYNSTSKTITVS